MPLPRPTGLTLPSSYGSRLATGVQGGIGDGPARPMTAVKGAGFGATQRGYTCIHMNE